MEDFGKYIYALRKCAEEHQNDSTSTFCIRVSDLCNDTANMLERLKKDESMRHKEKLFSYLDGVADGLNNPIREKGEWEYKDIPNTTIKGYWCNKCHIGAERMYAFCPNCGADMRGET